GQERYREITSTSNTTDYQARRLEIRHRRDGKQLEPVHTLNGTAVTARAMLAIMENFQEEDGSISIPEALHEFGAPVKLGTERGSSGGGSTRTRTSRSPGTEPTPAWWPSPLTRN